MTHEFDHEPIPGLPAHLPEGESILWQGSPTTSATAWRVLHVGWVAVYFAVLLAWRFIAGFADGHALTQIAFDSIPLVGFGSAAILILVVLARLIARTTIYTITTRRVVMRYGVALPISVNVPFQTILNADAAFQDDGTGDVALQVNDLGRLTYFHLWPHARPWHVRKAQPSLRGVPDAKAVATLLSRALHQAAGAPEKAVRPAPARAAAARHSAPGGAASAAA